MSTKRFGAFEEIMSQTPAADMNIFGMPQDCDVSWLKKMAEKLIVPYFS